MDKNHNQMTDDELVDALYDIATGYTGWPVLVSWGVSEDRCADILTKLVDKQHPNINSATKLCPNCGTDDDTAWGECDCGYLPCDDDDCDDDDCDDDDCDDDDCDFDFGCKGE